jgi:nucleotide-binding universal stress UspA family protein
MRNILVPTDFSEQATNALEVAIEIGKLNKAEITLLHVIDLPAPVAPINAVGDYVSPFEDNLYLFQLMESSKTQLNQIKSDYESSGVTIHSKITPGNIFNSIEQEIEEGKTELVIMGSKGSSGIDEILIGSNTEKVVRRVKCPVLTVKQKMNPFVVKDIIFATNLAEDQGLVLKHIKRFQDLFKATIHLVTINSPSNFEDTKSLKRKMDDFVQRYQLKDFTTNIYNSKDKEQGIINFAEEINANIIAMGTHGRTGFAHLINGSVAEDVVNHAQRMVLTVNMGH